MLNHKRKQWRRSKLRSNACLPCKRRKKKCNGGHPCSTCLWYGTGAHCKYDANSDGRRKRYDSAQVDYLEMKSDMLEQYALQLIKSRKELTDFDLKTYLPEPPKLMENNDPEQLKKRQGLNVNANILEDVVSTAWRVVNDGGDTIFYGPLSGRQSIDTDEHWRDQKHYVTNIDITFMTENAQDRLFEIFENNFVNYLYIPAERIGEMKGWVFPNRDGDKQLLLCSIFAYAAFYMPGKSDIAKRFLMEAENNILSVCRYHVNCTSIQALLILSCTEAGIGNDRMAWELNASCAALTQYNGLHLRDGNRRAARLDYSKLVPESSIVSVSPKRSCLFWSVILHDRFLTSALGRGCRIQYFRITMPFYSPQLNIQTCGNNAELLNQYISELTFSLHSRLWYIHDRTTQQIYSFKADYLHPSHRMLLIRQGFEMLHTLYNSFPQEVLIKPDTTEGRILLLHLSFHTVLLLLPRPYIMQNPPKILAMMVKHCSCACKIVEQYSRYHGFNNAPYFVPYLIFQCATTELFLLAHKNVAFHDGASARFLKFLTALSECADSWHVAIKDILFLDHLAQKWDVHVDVLDQIRKKSRQDYSTFSTEESNHMMNQLHQIDVLNDVIHGGYTEFPSLEFNGQDFELLDLSLEEDINFDVE